MGCVFLIVCHGAVVQDNRFGAKCREWQILGMPIGFIFLAIPQLGIYSVPRLALPFELTENQVCCLDWPLSL